MKSGFTLIELSIVLIIIGLITGGVLVGQDLISAATIRAQISQIEKYQTAVNTFRGKYGYLPGDIPDPVATQYGFKPRGTDCNGTACPGEGDGDGILLGTNNPPIAYGVANGGGETAEFWVDLSTAKLLDGSFTVANETQLGGAPLDITNLYQYFPFAKLGRQNYVYVFSGGSGAPGVWNSSGFNYFGIQYIKQLYTWAYDARVAMTVAEAYAIDRKIDDGMPQTGRVTAQFVSYYNGVGYGLTWAAGGGNAWGGGVGGNQGASDTSPTFPTADTCYDNANSNGQPQQYSMGQNNGTGINCALSFKFQ